MRNRIFGWIMTVGFVAGGGEVAAQEPLRQGPQEEGVVLRFDEARRDTLADVPSATAETLPAAAGRPFAYKLNRRRVTREEAYFLLPSRLATASMRLSRAASSSSGAT